MCLLFNASVVKPTRFPGSVEPLTRRVGSDNKTIVRAVAVYQKRDLLTYIRSALSRKYELLPF